MCLNTRFLGSVPVAERGGRSENDESSLYKRTKLSNNCLKKFQTFKASIYILSMTKRSSVRPIKKRGSEMWISGYASISSNLRRSAGDLIEGLMPGIEEMLQAARKTGRCTQTH